MQNAGGNVATWQKRVCEFAECAAIENKTKETFLLQITYFY